MFELNLIKDKAAARQRRRIVFLSVACIALFSGLSGIFVGGLIYTEWRKVETVGAAIVTQQATVTSLEADLMVRQPRADARRTALIKAWQESFDVQQDRPRFTPLLLDLSRHRPQTDDFWYNSVTVSRAGAVRRTGGGDEDRFAEAEGLMRTRSLIAGGYVRILHSDILTESELRQVAARMQGMVPLVGEPIFDLQSREEGRGGPGADLETRYAGFSMTTVIRAGTARGSPGFTDTIE